MPRDWNNIYVVTVDELIPNWYKSLGTLKSEICRYKDKPYGIKKVCRGGNGRVMLIAFDSLRKEIRLGIGDGRKVSHIMERFYKTDSQAVRYYSDHRFEDGSYLDLKYQEEYIVNASVLNACIDLKLARENEWRSKGKRSLKGLLLSIYKDVLSFNSVLKIKHGTTHTLPGNDRRFMDDYKAYESLKGEERYNYLISKRLKNENAKKVTDSLTKLLNDLFATQSHKPTKTEVARQFEAFLGGYVEVINSDTGEMYNPKAYKAIGERSITSYLSLWENKIGAYAKRSGDRQKLMGQFKPYHSLSRPAFAGSIISVDDRQPPFEYAKGQRVWFYNGIDIAGDAYVCWVHGKSKEGIIIDFYRQLVRNYTEWGFRLPFELECESSLNSSYTTTFLRPGVLFDKVRIEANNARGKYIEGRNRPMRYDKEKKEEGWRARPFARSEANQTGSEPVPLRPYNEIVEICLKHIENHNNEPHPDHPDKTRWEVFCEKQHPDLKPVNWRALLPHLGFATNTGCRAGIIQLQNSEFLLGDNDEVFTGESLINLMKEVEGKEITAYWLDDNKGNVLKALIYMDQRCICQAIPKPRYNRASIERTPEDEANRAIMSSYVATIEAFMRKQKNSLEKVTIIDHREKTLNRKFVMPGLKSFEAGQESEPELLPVPEDINLDQMEQKNFARSLRDRF